ncbi:30S ribosomal protein S6e [Methanosarcinales archaeon ex4572_44]|nr:MAG: 30S ribosomal protein S6e [Methanosarcinales archaeon ex4484_138]PHP46203.1 MAG: 30S ribosomal protein S6e [Methanosarcinales archaeon ex4572_44]RLG28062.1 MAG: 30S ribosomal protein S6e [Methanosarcinales archaeon]
MADFRVVISDPSTGKSHQVEVSGSQANKFITQRIGDTIEGDAAGLGGYTLKITGGSDKDGFSMRPDLPGPARRKLLVSKSTGFKPKRAGLRRRKAYRGREISSETGQINLVVIEHGRKTVDEIFAPPQEETKAEETGEAIEEMVGEE